MVRRAPGLLFVLALSGCLTRSDSPIAGELLSLLDANAWTFRVGGRADDDGFFVLQHVIVGDVNGDGIGDLIMAAPGADLHGRHNGGAVYVRFGNPAFPSGARDLSLLAEFDLRLDGPGSDVTVQTGFGRGLAVGDLNGDGFGDLVIGDPENGVPASANGSVYVIFGGPGIGTGVRDFALGGYSLRITGEAVGDRFGDTVTTGDVNGDGIADLVVGAPNRDAAGRPDSGAAYVFFGGAGFTPGTLPASDAAIIYHGRQVGDTLGMAVAVVDLDITTGPDLVIGAPFNDDPSGPLPFRQDAGALFVISGGPGIPTGTIDLANDANSTIRFIGAANDDWFGMALAVGDVDGNGANDLVVGAPNALAGAGRVYVYKDSSIGPGDVDASVSLGIANAFGPAGVAAGSSVAVVQHDGQPGADLLIGAPLADFNGRTNSGSVYLVSGGANLSSPNPNHDLSMASHYAIRYDGERAEDRLGDRFTIGGGSSVTGAPSSNELFLGARGWDLVLPGETPRNSCGVIHGFLNQGAPSASVDLASQPDHVRFIGAGRGTGFSRVLAFADLNGDGQQDLVWGSSLEDRNNRKDSGTVYVKFGGPALGVKQDLGVDDPGAWDLRIEGAAAFDQLGERIFGNGDLNGDGIDDLIVSAARADNTGANSGSVYVLFGRTNWPKAVWNLASLGDFDVRIDGAGPGDLLGWSVSIGDLDKDGIGDLLLYAPQTDYVASNTGSLYVLYGRTSWPMKILDTSVAGSFDARFDGQVLNDQIGITPAVGDLDRDGFPDLVIGAPLTNFVGIDSGSIYVLYGRGTRYVGVIPLGNPANYDARVDGIAPGDQFGNGVNVRDLDRDGAADLIIGAIGVDAGGANAGATYIWYGRPQRLAGILSAGGTVDATFIGNQPGGEMLTGTVTSIFRPPYLELVLSPSTSPVAFVFAGWNNRYAGTLQVSQADITIHAASPSNFLSITYESRTNTEVTGDGWQDLVLLERNGDSRVTDAGTISVVPRSPP